MRLTPIAFLKSLVKKISVAGYKKSFSFRKDFCKFLILHIFCQMLESKLIIEWQIASTMS